VLWLLFPAVEFNSPQPQAPALPKTAKGVPFRILGMSAEKRDYAPNILMPYSIMNNIHELGTSLCQQWTETRDRTRRFLCLCRVSCNHELLDVAAHPQETDCGDSIEICRCSGIHGRSYGRRELC